VVIRSEKQDNSFNAGERKILLTADKSEITLIDDESEIILLLMLVKERYF